MQHYKVSSKKYLLSFMTSLRRTINPCPFSSTLFPVAIKAGWKHWKTSFCPARMFPGRRPWNFCSQTSHCDGIQPLCLRQECNFIQNPASLMNDDILGSPSCHLSADTCMCEQNIVSCVVPHSWWLQRAIYNTYLRWKM